MKLQSSSSGIPSGKFREAVENLSMYRQLTWVALVANCILISLCCIYL